MGKNGVKTKVIMKENKDAGESFASIMKNTRDPQSMHNKMLEIKTAVTECTKFMRTMSKLIHLEEDESKPDQSYLIALANWMDYEVSQCFEDIDIKQNILGLYEYQNISKDQIAVINFKYNSLMDSFTIMNMMQICKNLSLYKQYLCEETIVEIKHQSGRTSSKKTVNDVVVSVDGRHKFAIRLFNAIPGTTFKVFTIKTVTELLEKLENDDEDTIKHNTKINTILEKNAAEIEIVVKGCKDIDIKDIYMSSDETYKYAIAICCSKLYVRTYKVSQAIRIPDMNPSRIREAVENGLARYKNERVIKANKGAYNELCDSVMMLEENFDRYYDGYVKTGNVTNIFENYVMDVAEAKKDKQHMKLQFSRIVQFFKMKASPIVNNTQSAELRALFNTADRQFSSMLSEAEKLDMENNPLDDADETHADETHAE